MNPGLKLANAVGVPAKHRKQERQGRSPFGSKNANGIHILKQNANGVH
jgi:hypothetical protein